MSYCNQSEYKIVPTESFKIKLKCQKCGRKMLFVNTGCFRVNANGNKLDVWLIYQCKKCKHTKNLTIYERRNAAKINPEEYELFLCNDETLARKYGTDVNLFRRNKSEIAWSKRR